MTDRCRRRGGRPARGRRWSVSRTLSTCAATAVIVVGRPAHGQSSPVVQVRAYELDVRFHPDRGAMDGQATITFLPSAVEPDSLTFYLHGELSVDSVRWEGMAVPVTQEKVFYFFDYSLIATKVAFARGSRSLASGVAVFYGGSFNPSRARSPSDYMRVDGDGVLLRGYAYSPWLPIFLDARQSSYRVSFPRVTIRTPAAFRAVFVGTQVAEREEGGQRVAEWRASDVDLLDVQCSARRWQVAARGTSYAYHLPNEASRRAAEHLLAISEQLTGRFGRYYRARAVTSDLYLMEMPEFGDISSGNVVGLAAPGWITFEQAELAATEAAPRIETMAHELVHPFVRPRVDYGDSLWAMAIEGFPSYFYLPVLAELLGEEYYRARMHRIERAYLQNREHALAGRRGMPPEKPLLAITADELPRYKDRFLLGDRGALFFNYLRVRMGPDGFFAFTRDLFGADTLDAAGLKRAILVHLPDADEAVRLWLSTTEYPDRFRLQTLWP